MELINTETFRNVLVNEVGRIKDKWRKKEDSDAFVLWAATQLLGLNEQKANVACRFQGPGERGIDLFYVDHAKKLLVIGQGEVKENFGLDREFGREILSKLHRALAFLNDPSTLEDPKLLEAAQLYARALQQKYDIELWVLISGRVGKGLKREARAFQSELSGRYEKHRLEIYNVGKLLERYCGNIEGQPPPNDVRLPLVGGKSYEYPDGSLVFAVPGAGIARLVKEHGLILFETNARLPILNSQVNEEIEGTLKNPSKKKFFWHFNNGLTITCYSFDWEDRRSKNKLVIDGIQIVNGCQTAWTIHKHTEKTLKDVAVLVKLIKTKNPRLSEDIRRGTNWQNAITERDLRSGEFIQKRLQVEFGRKFEYFYERKRNEWRLLCKIMGKPAMTSRFLNWSIDNQRLAQLYLAFWLGMPSQAKMKKKEIFKLYKTRPHGYYDQIFKPDTTAEDLMLPYLVREFLYDELRIGFRPRGIRRTRIHEVKIHGDLTMLALMGRILKRKYGSNKRKLRLIISKLENPDEHRYFYTRLHEVARDVFKAFHDFMTREISRAERQGESPEVRDILVRDVTFRKILSDQRAKRVIRKSRGRLPSL